MVGRLYAKFFPVCDRLIMTDSVCVEDYIYRAKSSLQHSNETEKLPTHHTVICRIHICTCPMMSMFPAGADMFAVFA